MLESISEGTFAPEIVSQKTKARSITIIGIPFGKQCFKFAKLSAFPFGKSVDENFGSHPIANVIWLLLGGLEMAIGFFFIGLIWCITIVGIPFGKQCFKLALLSLAPFGAQIRKG